MLLYTKNIIVIVVLQTAIDDGAVALDLTSLSVDMCIALSDFSAICVR